MAIHVGLIGGGNISETHAREAGGIPGVKIAAVYGTDREKVARLCTEYGATPYSEAEPGIAVVRRGLHVLAEKPLDISTARGFFNRSVTLQDATAMA